MGLLLTGNAGSYAQLITVLLIFVAVLGITALTTRWIANNQKQQAASGNIQVIETARISGSKYLQIVRIGETYKVIAVCKDTVTLLGEVPADQLKPNVRFGNFSFRELLDKAAGKRPDTAKKPEESRGHDET